MFSTAVVKSTAIALLVRLNPENEKRRGKTNVTENPGATGLRLKRNGRCDGKKEE